jgi:hypothetical protein
MKMDTKAAHTAINDSGGIIANHLNVNSENPPQELILQNGVYKSLNFVPSDLNNAGTNDLGVVTGNANYPASGGAFTWKNRTAVCH